MHHSTAAVLVASSLLLASSDTVSEKDCIDNNLPGHEHFCLKVYEKGVRLTDNSCRSAVDMLHADHLKLQCTSGVNSGRDWEIWCFGGTKCNISQHALCTYDSERMNGAEEWNPGQHCTEQIR